MNNQMSKQDKIKHTWLHHAKWGDPTKRHVGIGVVEWHDLNENNEVTKVDIRFGKTLYEDVPITDLEPVKVNEHSHHKRKKKKKSSMKEMLDDIIMDTVKGPKMSESKDKLIGGQGTKKGKLMLYQRSDDTFYMTLKGKEAPMEPGLIKNKSDAIKAASMFAKMINNT